jgi:uncharacterized protein (DUF885 family)
VPEFSELARAFLEEEYAESPTGASSLGLTQYDDQLPDLSEAGYARRSASVGRWMETFSGIDPQTLGFDEAIDRDLVLASLHHRVVFDEWEVWRRHPDTYLGPGLGGVFSLFLHRLRPEAELAASAAARLRGVPANLEDGKRNLRAELVPAILLDRAVNQARAGARYARELLPAEIADATARAQLAEAGAVAAAAYEDFAAFLEEMRPNATGDWAFGESRYTAILRDAELLDMDARELREKGRQQLAELDAELRRCAQDLRGTDDWHAVLAELNKDRPATPEDMRIGYEDWTQKARDYLAEHALVSFAPGESCSVEPSPPFQRPVIAVASYQNPPAFAPSMRGHFFVPFPPDGASPDDIAKRLEYNSYPGIPTTAVHEAYPGHHWHLSMAKLNPSHLRQSLGTSYFSEGWALYAERMMREQGFFADKRHEMYQYEATIFRAARIVVDTSLHMGEMTWDEAVEFMLANTSLTDPTARAEVTRYCSWPTQASSYLTGCLEIVRIRDRFLGARGATIHDIDHLRAFHDALVSSGDLPIALAERAVMAKA